MEVNIYRILNLSKKVIISGLFFAIGLIGYQPLFSQILTHEDSLSAGLTIRGNSATAISGYGEISYQNRFYNHTATAQLNRAVLFIGHRFSSKITFFSEIELENAKVSSSSNSGEISMEQCFIKFDLNRMLYINAGFFTPRIGIINENHLPNTYNGVFRPITETMLIPSTWREIGVALYGKTRSLPGLNYSIGVMNGLNAENFNLESGIRNGRSEGFMASARNIALTASLLYYYSGWRLQSSAYYGGSVGLDDTTSARLDLNSGAFGTPVSLVEANAQYRKNGFSFKGLVSMINIPQASNINAAFANNTPERMIGYYFELGYDMLFHKFKQEKQCISFMRYEHIDMNSKIPENGLKNMAFTQDYLTVGLTYLPIRGIAIKAEYQKVLTGDFNSAFIVNPMPYLPVWFKNKDILNIGLTYSF